MLTQALLEPRPMLVQTANWLPQGFRQSAYFREVFHAHGFPAEGGCLGDLLHDGQSISRFAVLRQSRKPYPARSLRNLATLWPHMVRAARLTLQLVPRAQTQPTRCLLDLCPLGVLVIDSAGRVVDANAIGRHILQCRDALRCQAGLLVACADETRARFERALSNVAKTGRSPAEALLLATVSGARAHVVSIVQSSARLREALGANVAALAFVQNPQATVDGDRALLEELYELTHAEAATAAAIAQGRTVAEVAAQMRVSTNTIRTHLYRVFDKLHVTHQSELAHLLLTGPFVITRPPS